MFRRALSTAVTTAAKAMKPAKPRNPGGLVELQGTALTPKLTCDQLETVILSSPSKAFTVDNCSQTIYMLGTKASKNKFALERVLALSKDREFTPQHLSQIFVGLCTNRAISKFPEFLVHHPTLALGLHLFSPVDLSSVLYSFARLNQNEPEVVLGVAKEIATRDLCEFTGDDLSTLLYSFARLGNHEEEEEEIKAAVKHMGEELKKREKWMGFRSVDFSDLLCSIAHFSLLRKDVPLVRKWKEEIMASGLTRWRGSDFTKIISSLPSVFQCDEAQLFLQEYLFGVMLDRGHFKFNGHDLAKQCQAFATLKISPPAVYFERMQLLVEAKPGEFRIPALKSIISSVQGLEGSEKCVVALEKDLMRRQQQLLQQIE